MTIHLGRELLHGSSNLPGGKTGRLIAALFGFAPDGACLARTVTRPAGELLPHPFTLTATGAAVCSLLRLPGVTPAGRYPASRPVEPGLSSRRLNRRPAVIRPARPGFGPAIARAAWSFFIFLTFAGGPAGQGISRPVQFPPDMGDVIVFKTGQKVHDLAE